MPPSTTSLARGRTPIVAGGTGLYLRAALAELDAAAAAAARAARAPRRRTTTPIPHAAYARLEAADPAAAARIHPQRPPPRGAGARAGRARGVAAPGRRRPAVDDGLRHPTRIVGLRRRAGRAAPADRPAARRRCSRPAWWRRCAPRSRRRAVRDGGAGARPGRDPRRASPATTDRDDACRRLVERTRQYARRQEIWMRRIPGIELLEPAAPSAATWDDAAGAPRPTRHRARARVPRRRSAPTPSSRSCRTARAPRSASSCRSGSRSRRSCSGSCSGRA